MLGDLFDSTIPYNARFFETLDRFVQREPWLESDKVMIDQLKTIGIEKGKPFRPDAGTRRSCDAPRSRPVPVLIANTKDLRKPFNEGTRWALPADADMSEGMQTNFSNPDAYPVDGRGITYSMAYFSAKHIGEGQYYLMTIVDKKGKPFGGARTYRLNVPANAPVALYWSATAYDRVTHALIRDLARSSRASKSPGIQKNSDGSVDLYFAPKAPPGKESNWVPTRSGSGFEVLFRLYGPQKPFFDKTWILPDVELMR